MRRRRRAGRGHVSGALISALLVALGLGILGLALVPWGSDSGRQTSITPLPDEALAVTRGSQPRRVTARPDATATAGDSASSGPAVTAAASGSATPRPGSTVITRVAALPTATRKPPSETFITSKTPVPAQRDAAPIDALPVTRLQAVSGGSQDWIAQVAARTTEQLEVAIVSLSGATDPLARATASLLVEKQINAYVAPLSDVRRPDVVLLLDASPGGASVWYCSPSQAASESLALDLLDGVGSLSQNAEDTATDVSQSMPCDSLQLGRASSAAAMVRLPAEAAGPGAEASSALADAVSKYLTQNAAAIRLSRAAVRMTWPAIGPITSEYGPGHPLGIDIGQSAGDIVAATDGTVTFAGGDPCCSYGLHVIIDGPGEIETVYGHLSSIAVSAGQQVHLGQRLGVVGCTGHCTGPHLHFEVVKDGVRQNPMEFLP